MADFNPLADEDMAEQVADLYLKAALQRHALQVLQIANGDGPDAPVPGTRPKLADDGVTVLIEDGKPVFPTYGEQIASYAATMERLESAYEPIWSAVQNVLNARKEKLAA